jgi:hypothetical protein
MIHLSQQAEAAKKAAERSDPSYSSSEAECCYAIMIPVVIVGWVLLFIYVIL